MKRTIKAITAVVVVLTLCLGLLTGCSGITGKWTAKSASAAGFSIEIPEEYQGMSFELKSDKTCVISVGGISTNAEWMQDGNKLTIGSYPATLNDAQDTIEIDIFGICKLNFERQK